MKKIICLIMATFFVLQLAQAKDAAVDAGNEICPVMGIEIKKGEEIKYEHEGKIYNLCCSSCVEEFKKDQQKYIKKVEEELESKSKEESEHKEHEAETTHGSGASHQGMHESHPH